MSLGVVVARLALFGAGLLAGGELIVRYGVRGPLAELADEAHIRLRQGLIRTLRILVPSIALPTLVLTALAVVLAGADGRPGRITAAAALLVWLVVTLAGTAPINAAALNWDPTAPPAGWAATVERWERLNTVRTALAGLAFALLVVAGA